MKKLLLFVAVCLCMTALTVSALAVDNYELDGAKQHNFGKPTSTDSVTAEYPAPAAITNKNAALIPPAFGSPSAYMPGTGERLTPNLIGGGDGPDYGSTVYTGAVTMPPSTTSGTTTTTTTNSGGNFTMPDFYSDGSIGRLQIPRLNVDIKVYEDESLESLAKGAGHFKFTSAWAGNVGLAAHNRGVNNYFGQIHTLKNGDTITYTTKYGTRTYQVYYVGQISETDFTLLQRTNENILTLITCVRDVPTMRVAVQAREVR